MFPKVNKGPFADFLIPEQMKDDKTGEGWVLRWANNTPDFDPAVQPGQVFKVLDSNDDLKIPGWETEDEALIAGRGIMFGIHIGRLKGE